MDHAKYIKLGRPLVQRPEMHEIQTSPLYEKMKFFEYQEFASGDLEIEIYYIRNLELVIIDVMKELGVDYKNHLEIATRVLIAVIMPKYVNANDEDFFFFQSIIERMRETVFVRGAMMHRIFPPKIEDPTMLVPEAAEALEIVELKVLVELQNETKLEVVDEILYFDDKITDVVELPKQEKLVLSEEVRLSDKAQVMTMFRYENAIQKHYQYSHFKIFPKQIVNMRHVVLSKKMFARAINLPIAFCSAMYEKLTRRDLLQLRLLCKKSNNEVSHNKMTILGPDVYDIFYVWFKENFKRKRYDDMNMQDTDIWYTEQKKTIWRFESSKKI